MYDPGRNDYVVTAWLQDVIYPITEDHDLILRYMTSDASHPAFANPMAVTGSISVYERFQEDLRVVAEFAIRNDSYGNPVWIDGIQVYTPKKRLATALLEDGTYQVVTEGSFNYCPVYGPMPGKTCTPWHIDGSWYRYQVAIEKQGTTVLVDEQYLQSLATPYHRTFVYSSLDNGHTLKEFHDLVLGYSYYRHRTAVDGVCHGRY